MNVSVGLRERSGHISLAALGRRCMGWMAEILRNHGAAELKNRLIVFVRNTNDDVLVDQHGNAAWLEIWRKHDEDYVMLLRSSICGHWGIDVRATTLHWLGGFRSVEDEAVSVRSDIFLARVTFMAFSTCLPAGWSWSNKPELSAHQASVLEQALSNG